MRRLAMMVALGACFAASAASAEAQTASGPLWRPGDGRRAWPKLALGFATSIAAHEAAHFATALALGARPYVGVTKGRPTVYSGIDPDLEPDKQAAFSGAGLIAQMLIDEALLDVPGATRSTYARGVLAGGIATSLFYITLGRNGAVSDVELTARYSSLSKDQVTLVLGGVALMHAARLSLRGRELQVAALPGREGTLIVRFAVSSPTLVVPAKARHSRENRESMTLYRTPSGSAQVRR